MKLRCKFKFFWKLFLSQKICNVMNWQMVKHQFPKKSYLTPKATWFYNWNQRDSIQRGPLWEIDLTQPASLRPLASYLQFRVMYFKVKTLEEIWKNFVPWGGLEPLTLPWIWHTCALYQLSYCGLILNPTDPWFV